MPTDAVPIGAAAAAAAGLIKFVTVVTAYC